LDCPQGLRPGDASREAPPKARQDLHQARTGGLGLAASKPIKTRVFGFKGWTHFGTIVASEDLAGGLSPNINRDWATTVKKRWRNGYGSGGRSLKFGKLASATEVAHGARVAIIHRLTSVFSPGPIEDATSWPFGEGELDVEVLALGG